MAPVVDQPPHTPTLLQRFLTEQDAPCPACGYNLRGLSGTACPECNSALVLRVGLVEPRLGAYVTGLVGWSMGAGLSLLMLTLGAIVSVSDPTARIPARAIVVLSVGGAVQVTGLAAWILIFGRRVRCPHCRGRWLLAASGWVVSLANVVSMAVFAE